MIIEVVGKEIEKIKGDFESYLNGLNMVGEISYSQYSELYDEGVKQIQRAYELGKSELEKENAELKEKLGDIQMQKAGEKSDLVWKLKTANEQKADQLTKAKEIIKTFCGFCSVFNSTNGSFDNLIVDAEQFLKDNA